MGGLTNRDDLWAELDRLGVPFREPVATLVDRYMRSPDTLKKDGPPRYPVSYTHLTLPTTPYV